ncbi:hypothetical protein ACQ4LE_002382 [Meloidogyne hapla]
MAVIKPLIILIFAYLFIENYAAGLNLQPPLQCLSSRKVGDVIKVKTCSVRGKWHCYIYIPDPNGDIIIQDCTNNKDVCKNKKHCKICDTYLCNNLN